MRKWEKKEIFKSKKSLERTASEVFFAGEKRQKKILRGGKTIKKIFSVK